MPTPMPSPPAAANHRLRADEAMQAAALAVSTAEGEGVFRGLVDSLARILGVELAFIALPSDERPGELKMLAFHMDGKTIEDFRYPMAGTPCETVIGQRYRAYPSDLQRLFPQDGDFAQLGVNAYAGYPLTDAHGKPLGIISVVTRGTLPDADLVESMLKIFAARAVTEIERNRADAALRASEEQYRAIFNASADALVLWDSRYRRVDVNPAYERLYGWSRGEVIGRGYEHPAFSPEYARPRLELVRRALAGETCHAELEAIRKNGERVPTEVRAIPFQHRGQPHVLTIARDITERKRAEHALRASEEQYRAIFNASADALILWDSQFRRVDVNPAYEKMYGRTRDEVIGRGYDLPEYSAEYAGQRKDLVRRALAGETARAELDATRKNGERIQTEVVAIPFRHRGEPHVLAIARDITERKRAESERHALEAQLRQAQKMEAIGQLTGGIAHDFNNILTSVLGYTTMALERAEASGDATLTRYLQQTQRASQRARDLVQQMLTFSRGRRGERRSIALAPLVRESLTLLRSTLPASIDLDSELDGSVPAVLADPVQLEQVLLNLCINARDAIDGTGSIRVTLRRVAQDGVFCASCRAPVHGAYVEIAVRDSGTGIPPEVVDRMFEPFYTTKDVGKGSGMGLSTAHGIVHEHDGHIAVDSRVGSGATFRVLLPVPVDELAAPAGDSPGAARTGTAQRLAGRVLVVDDEAMVAGYLGELLAGWGLDVTVLTNPHDAYAWFCAAPDRVDLVLTDQAMPRQTGIELARLLTLQRPELPVLLHTGYREDLAPDEIARSGVAETLVKPVDPGALWSALRKHLPRR
ncbi:MAG: PAS domain S-box protein [Burkholderiales bacterium]